VSRFLFFILLVAIAAFGAHLWLAAPADPANFAARERNRDAVRIVAVTPPTVAARAAEETRRAVQNLSGAACVEFSGIAASDVARAREAFSALRLGERLIERRIEDITRYWVFMPAARDRRSAEVTMAQLRRQNVTDMSIRPDNTISLGVFSTEDGARRFLASIENKGVRGAEIGPFVRDLREIVMLVRDPDTETVARLTILQRDYGNAQLRAVPCPPAAEPQK
jgi:hypothetical protein